MQRTKSKILSILLSLVMLLSLLPTTALATTYNDVKVNGVSLGDGEYEQRRNGCQHLKHGAYDLCCMV